jgi:hypothetical protein
MNGDVLNDAIFNRNAKVEEAFHLNFKITTADIYDLNGMVQSAVAANEDIYDAVYIKPDQATSLITENMLVNLPLLAR